MALNDERTPKSSFGLRCATFCSVPLGLNFDFGLLILGLVPFGLNFDFGLLILGLSLLAFAELAALPLGLDREAMGVR
jgi:hypothetical protein